MSRFTTTRTEIDWKYGGQTGVEREVLVRDYEAMGDAIEAVEARLSALEGKAAETGKGRVPGWYPVNIAGYITPALRFWCGNAWLYRQGGTHTSERDHDFSWIGPRIEVPEGGR